MKFRPDFSFNLLLVAKQFSVGVVMTLLKSRIPAVYLYLVKSLIYKK